MTNSDYLLMKVEVTDMCMQQVCLGKYKTKEDANADVIEKQLHHVNIKQLYILEVPIGYDEVFYES